MRRFRKTIRHPETFRRNQRPNPSSQFDYTVDLHGMTVDEAVRAMKNVITANIGRSVLINHGKGTGTLRTAVRLLCKNDPRVKKIRNGEEVLLLGTDGVTVIEL